MLEPEQLETSDSRPAAAYLYMEQRLEKKVLACNWKRVKGTALRCGLACGVLVLSRVLMSVGERLHLLESDEVCPHTHTQRASLE